MLARICTVFAMLILSGVAGAADWRFRFQGFLDGDTGIFLPDVRLEGNFSGNDGDGNGVIDMDELTGFTLAGHEYVHPNCSDPSSGFYCNLDAFSYRLNGRMTFDATEAYYDVIGYANRYRAEDRIVSIVYGFGGEEYTRVQYWTSQTTFTITPPLVPEPSMASLAVIGLIALARQYCSAARQGRYPDAPGRLRGNSIRSRIG